MLIPIDLKPGEPNWSTLQDASIDDAFELQQFLGADTSSAVFKARSFGCPAPNAVIKFYKVTDEDAAENQLAIWDAATRLTHPNLIQVLGAGRSFAGNVPLVWVALEPADESLGSALYERYLEPEEASEMLKSARSALQYLHDRGFVHSCLSPDQIFAVDDAIKLSTEGIRRDGSHLRLLVNGAKYIAPESQETNTTPSADVWCLGATLLEALTLQNVSSGIWSVAKIPVPFDAIIQRCLQPEGSRPALSDIDHGPVPAFVPNGASPQPLQAAPGRDSFSVRDSLREPPKTIFPQNDRLIPFLVCGAGFLVLIAALFWLFHSKSSKPKATASAPAQVAAAQPKVIPPADNQPRPAPAARPSPMHGALFPRARSAQAVPAPQKRAAPDAPTQKGQVWRVVVYTYNREDDAKKKAEAINQKHPELKASVFSPEGHSPFLVVVGGGMSRDQATRIRQTALRAGMPKDSYAQNYSR